LGINWWMNGMSLGPKQLYSPFSLFVTTRNTNRSLSQLKALSKRFWQNTMINLSDAFLFHTNQNTTLSSTWLVSEKHLPWSEIWYSKVVTWPKHKQFHIESCFEVDACNSVRNVYFYWTNYYTLMTYNIHFEMSLLVFVG